MEETIIKKSTKKVSYTALPTELVVRKITKRKTTGKRIMRAIIIIGASTFLGLVAIIKVVGNNILLGTIIGLIIGILLVIAVELLNYYSNQLCFLSITSKKEFLVKDKFGEELYLFQSHELANVILVENHLSFKKNVSHTLCIETGAENHIFDVKVGTQKMLEEFVENTKELV